MTTKVRFFRAKADPSSCEYDPSEDDTMFLAWGCRDVGMSGWFECAACGDPNPVQGCTITTPAGKWYAYGLCAPCHGAMQDSTHFPPITDVKDAQQWRDSLVPGKGVVARKVEAELDAFIAAGEPLPPEVGT